MAFTVQKIFQNTQNWDQSQVAYLVSSGMLGTLVQGNPHQAFQLWQKYETHLGRTKKKPFTKPSGSTQHKKWIEKITGDFFETPKA